MKLKLTNIKTVAYYQKWKKNETNVNNKLRSDLRGEKIVRRF